MTPKEKLQAAVNAYTNHMLDKKQAESAEALAELEEVSKWLADTRARIEHIRKKTQTG